MASFTDRAIKDSFIKLLNEKPMKQITVKDIVEDCGINRNSFYYHFADIPTLAEEIIKEELDALIESDPDIGSLEDSLKVAMEFAQKNRRAIYHVYNSVNREMLEFYLLEVCEYATRKYLETVAGEDRFSKEDMELLIRFYKAQSFGFILVWLKDGMKEDALLRLKRVMELRIEITRDLIERNIF